MKALTREWVKKAENDFKVASQIFNAEKKPEWKGSPEIFLMQLIGLVEVFLNSGKITVKDPLFNQDERRRNILIMLNMSPGH